MTAVFPEGEYEKFDGAEELGEVKTQSSEVIEVRGSPLTILFHYMHFYHPHISDERTKIQRQ